MARSSPSPTVLCHSRHHLLRAPLADLRSLTLIAHCGDPDCPPPRPIPVGDVMEARGNRALSNVVGGLHCTACGRAAQTVSLREDCPDGWILQPVVLPGASAAALN
ncbi:hypothetical protein [Roseomonas haemaphysalidis]|uniref:Uncharacterized protein n=1 Tax=Roseomonas haemaphysalidis TaxID=2768162 RepID=A0ABS3KMG1_9PROT|nr:hypothetical protein [Roseomonas haemaphysalidis]MBO1078155.1 hypothetical protein [Roseomonas haemaphysalidis]